MLAYLQLAVAVVLNVIAIYFLKKAQGFTLFWPALGNLVFIGLTGWLASRAMASGVDVGFATTLLGVGVVAGSILVGLFIFNESMSAQKLIGLGIAIIGIAVASMAKA